MASFRYHSGYLADDEAGHSPYVARVQSLKKPPLPQMGSARVPPPRFTQGTSAQPGPHRDTKGPQSFGSFLDFLTEGQVLESLQTVVEEATERMATMKTGAGVPLVEVRDPVVEPASGGRRPRARPTWSTVCRNRAQPSLCVGRPNNYPSRSSSVSDSRSSLTAGWLGSHGQGSDLGARGSGSLPPLKDRLLLEQSLKRLLKLERKGKSRSQPSRKDSLRWDSLGSQTTSQWSPEQPLSWFSDLLSSSTGTPEASGQTPSEEELSFLKQEFDKKLMALLSQPAALDLPGYCSLRQPHCTLDFLAQHHLFPALQSVVSQAVDKLSGARRHDGCPLFPANAEASSELPLHYNLLPPGSQLASPTDKEEAASPNTTTSIPRTERRKSKGTRGSPSMTSATRFKLKQSSNSKFSNKKPLPSISPTSSVSQLSDPGYKEISSFLVERAVSLLICKYKFEHSLAKTLGFLSRPVTETLMDLRLGFKTVKGSHIRLSSQMDWSCLLHKLEGAKRRKPATQLAAQHGGLAHAGQPEPSTTLGWEQAAEPFFSSDTELLGSQLDSPRESTSEDGQTPTSLLEPKLSMSSGTGMGASPPKSKKRLDGEYSEDRDGTGDDEGEEDESPPSEAFISHYVNLNPMDPL
ncbi:coiled-coil domain-containing protein 116 isoform X1 [Oryctolagus cuniculus]|uniref:coiled-coil domain-containing protein 116 isoform X1 n=1 Tax=Oryctolagus cuniculus TaxID=9986 RepID=UPI00048E8B62|nr:coiled-coil domain-containing protein 116 isoform X1 [Oryctolagus cuniculus]